uniref:Secreted protein n=1 Tax=Candidatus Kentrum sp. DK TaxID=2126562 RepID=A0A450SC28_9GAMM|nr:MAG: hypothetical protein BECKDK2373C_GA0170839_10272 [Candidatus Kentron sp. DK]
MFTRLLIRLILKGTYILCPKAVVAEAVAVVVTKAAAQAVAEVVAAAEKVGDMVLSAVPAPVVTGHHKQVILLVGDEETHLLKVANRDSSKHHART